MILIDIIYCYGFYILRFCCSCRKTQGVFDKCVSDNLGIDRPEYGYFTRAKVSRLFA